MFEFHRFILFQDSTGAWCAVPPNFREPVVDPLGWGHTREQAVANLLADKDFIARAQQGEWPWGLTVADFVELRAQELRGRDEGTLFLKDGRWGLEPVRRSTFKVIPGGRAK